MKAKGKRIRLLQRKNRSLADRIETLEESNTGLLGDVEELRAHMVALRREIDDYARQQQEIAWNVQRQEKTDDAGNEEPTVPEETCDVEGESPAATEEESA